MNKDIKERGITYKLIIFKLFMFFIFVINVYWLTVIAEFTHFIPYAENINVSEGVFTSLFHKLEITINVVLIAINSLIAFFAIIINSLMVSIFNFFFFNSIAIEEDKFMHSIKSSILLATVLSLIVAIITMYNYGVVTVITVLLFYLLPLPLIIYFLVFYKLNKTYKIYYRNKYNSLSKGESA